MKIQTKAALMLVGAMSAIVPLSFAQLAIPSDGSDGALVINNYTIIDLSQAVTGNWNDNNAAHAGNGIYDPSKWAVVFKYSSVTISGRLRFTNHPTHAPIVWLVSGDVTINSGGGDLDLDGHGDYVSWNNPAEPSPGGFRGGTIGMYGFGPGGGFGTISYYSTGYSYGNPQIVPLIGGSGSSANGYTGGGAGAILIACSGTITVNGTIHAEGVYVYGTSGGAIRLIAGQLTGNGSISVLGSDYGRIRLEATNAPGINLQLTGGVNPLAAIVSPFPLTLWPAPTAPTVQVMSFSNVNVNVTAPVDPKAVISAGGDDLAIATTDAVTIRLQTANFPVNGTVNVYLKSLVGGQTVIPASYVSGNSNSANWQVVTALPVDHTVIQARAVLP